MENFWENILRYPRFFISAVLGLVSIFFSPLFFSKKNSFLDYLIYGAIFVIFCVITIFTLKAMTQI